MYLPAEPFPMPGAELPYSCPGKFTENLRNNLDKRELQYTKNHRPESRAGCSRIFSQKQSGRRERIYINQQ